MWRALLLSLARDMVVQIIEKASQAALANVQAKVQQSPNLDDMEKGHVVNGANLLATVLKDEIAKQLNK